MSNSHALRRANPMAVCTNDLALGNLALCCGNALRVANIHRLAITNVVKVQSDWVGAVSAVSAATRNFVGVKPISDSGGASICNSVDSIAVSRLCQSRRAKFSPPFWRHGFPLTSGSGLAQRAANFRWPFCGKGRPANDAGESFRLNLFPRRHDNGIARQRATCKPDIFDATYEAAE